VSTQASGSAARWPETPGALEREQANLARLAPAPWYPPDGPVAVGGCFMCFCCLEAGVETGFAAATVCRQGALEAAAVVAGEVRAPYVAGLLALREGPLLEEAVRAVGEPPDVLLVNATGRDHPRRAGLALQLGAVLDLPTVGVTHRPLHAHGAWPDDEQGAASPLVLGGAVVGCWLRTRAGARPLAVHAAWRTDPQTARQVVLAVLAGRRTPEPLRLARTAARAARAGQEKRRRTTGQ